MYKSLVILGIILIAVGAVVFTGVYVPGASWRLHDLFAYIPISQVYSAIAVMVIGVIMIILGIGKSKMGKYFKFY